jgi:hypothetical protein
VSSESCGERNLVGGGRQILVLKRGEEWGGGLVHDTRWRKEGRGGTSTRRRGGGPVDGRTWAWRRWVGRCVVGENRGGAWVVLLPGCRTVNLGRPERTMTFSIYSKHFQIDLNQFGQKKVLRTSKKFK